ncbi:hypothetical protein LTR36_003043 [Oleoguttula mirabilis]|uniref:DUF6594 domain-containing protein n=1 Tax=Oleoguttula mirabilis TaxID=1507867 RepID=A0AAV9JYA9_9PEZI|nr:hypothetical protein LTR36_003043 [Oleoguttula mirabilis]
MDTLTQASTRSTEAAHAPAIDAAAVLSRQPEGYHELAEKLMGPYPELNITRRFNALNALSLLSMQAELTQLEVELKQASLAGGLTSFHALRKAQEDTPQRDLIAQIRKKISEYNAALLQTAGVATLPLPEEGNLRILRDWLEESNKSGDGSFLSGAEYLLWQEDHNDDFVCLAGTSDHDPFARWFRSRALVWYHSCLGRRCTKSGTALNAEKGFVQYSETRVAKVVALLASIISAVLPLVAIVILYYVQRTETRIWITVLMTTIFATVLATLTSARSQEVFAATAA